MEGLSQTGIRNVLTHEFGHALGLEHSEFADDLMYFERERLEVSGETLCPSNLDLYALALIYRWIETGVYRPYDEFAVALPETMEYAEAVCG